MEDGYYKTQESVKEYIKLAEDVNGKHLIDKLTKYIEPNSHILEIGTGPGTDWELLNQHYHTIGSDNSSEFLKHLQSEFPSGQFLDLDAVTLETNRQFDVIYSNKVMHHLNDEELTKSIQRQHKLLHAGGVICHSFWKGEGSEVFKGLFVKYHDETSITTFFKKHFDIVTIENYDEFDANDSLLLIAKKIEF